MCERNLRSSPNDAHGQTPSLARREFFRNSICMVVHVGALSCHSCGVLTGSKTGPAVVMETERAKP